MNSRTTELERMIEQRDRAFATLGLAAAIFAALVVANFGPSGPALEIARESVRIHQALIADHEQALKNVELALEQNRTELQRIRQAKGPRP